VPDRDRLDPCESSLGRRLDGAHDTPEPGSACAFRDGERAGDGPDTPVEGELSDRRVLGETLRRKLTRGRENRERDGEIESRALLPQRRRSEVHRDTPVERPLERGGDHTAPNPVFRLLTCAIREPDDREPGNAGLKVRLYLDAPRLESDEGMSDRTREHTLDGRRGGVT
jgi:hypothetical protein